MKNKTTTATSIHSENSEISNISNTHYQEYPTIELTNIEISAAVAAFTILRTWKREEQPSQPETEIEPNLSCDRS